MQYHQQIKHPLWQKKRLEVLEANNFQCEECESKEDELHVHHPFYKRGAMIWEYAVEELKCLCNKCHKDTHTIDELIKESLSFINIDAKTRILGYLDGMSGPVRAAAVDINGYASGYVDAHRDETGFIFEAIKSHYF